MTDNRSKPRRGPKTSTRRVSRSQSAPALASTASSSPFISNSTSINCHSSSSSALGLRPSGAFIEEQSTNEGVPSGVATIGEDSTWGVSESALSTTTSSHEGSVIHQALCQPFNVSFSSNQGAAIEQVLSSSYQAKFAAQIQSEGVNPPSAVSWVPTKACSIPDNAPPDLPPPQTPLPDLSTGIMYPRPIVQLQIWVHEARHNNLTVAEILHQATSMTAAEEVLGSNDHIALLESLDDLALTSDVSGQGRL